ncbi:VanW family protein [Natroniella sp. ANB-PHB2]|uniref:VanW family protein n=1 Tax=Natroniella sp. ANB-PHB2 TaxID=3384444 RepID=UPI0038D37BF4
MKRFGNKKRVTRMLKVRDFRYPIIIYSIVFFVLVSTGLANANFATGLRKLAEYNATDVVATYTTYFNKEEVNRNTNIRLAAKKVDGVVLKPKQVFSFNQVVGPRSQERGYKEAPEIIEGEFVDGIGGGICQVSSTLYNTVLLAGLEVVSRTNHSQPVRYVPLGRGATIYYDQIDFKFKNTSDYPIMIVARVLAQQLTVSLIGRDLGKSIELETAEIEVLEPEVVKKRDESLANDQQKIVQEGREGYKVVTKRKIKEGNQITKEEIISRDIYLPAVRVIKHNLNDLS